MAYLALYRKYRPVTFAGVVGQEPIIKTLKNQILSQRVSHAYLFCGTRGTGKTSTAKIFAKAINCMEIKEGEPCGHCALCQASQEGRSVNVIEIDAASNNGVDNIREIRQEVKYPPAEGKFKVYIIDEVHMLSGGAFNALLKTLEEPPEHVIFILATTDPQKVPATIHSRCQRFDFRRISLGEIAKTLKEYTTGEALSITPEALDYIARLADGSMRDALSILDQCVSFFFGEEITADKVQNIVGAADKALFFDMTEAIVERNGEKVLHLVDEVLAKGLDIKAFVGDFTEHMRNLLILSTVKEGEGILSLSEDTLERLYVQGKTMKVEEMLHLIRVLSQLAGDMKYLGNERILLEVTLLKLCSPMEEEDVTAIAARLSGLERRLSQGTQAEVLSKPQTEVLEKSKPQSPTTKPKKAPAAPAMPEEIQKAMNYWATMVQGLPMVERSLLKQGRIAYKEDGRLTVVCDEGCVGLMMNRIPMIQEAYEAHFQKNFEVQVLSQELFEQWEQSRYEVLLPEAVVQEDGEFNSLMEQYFPEE